VRSIFLNFELPEREYSKKGESMCPKDGWVCYRNSNLISGRLGKVRARGCAAMI
jgi:DNA-directed RNA polymerase III subunit RPC1